MNAHTDDDSSDSQTHLTSGLAGLDLNLLTVFDAVMTERHVTRAAERLNLTQSGVSNSLSRLRTLLGDQLFVKAAQGVLPTPKAMELWPVVHHSLEALQQAIRPRDFVAAASRRSFALSVTDVFATLLLPRLLTAFTKEAPAATLRLIPHDEQFTSVRLVRGEADFDISPELPRLAVLESVRLWSEPFVLVARKGHAILNEDLSVERLCEAPHVVVNMSGHADFFMDFDAVLASSGLSRNVKLSVNQFYVACAALTQSDLVAVMPTHFVLDPNFRPLLSFKRLPVAFPDFRVHLAWHRRNSALASHEWFKNLLFQAAADVKASLKELDAAP